MSSFLQPLRVLIDTNHLIEMGRLKRGYPLTPTVSQARRDAYRTILEQLGRGECALIFYELQSYEWVRKNSDERATEITDVFAHALAHKTLPVDAVLFRIEAFNEAGRVEPTLRFPYVEPVREFGEDPRLSLWFRSAFPDLARTVAEVPVVVSRNHGMSVENLTRAIASDVRAHPDCWQEAIDGHESATDVTRTTQAEHPSRGAPPEKLKRHWLGTALNLHDTLRHHHPDVDAHAVIERMQVSNCPAISLSVDVRWFYAKRNAVAKAGDVIDLSLAAPMAYADLVLTERSLADLVRQSSHHEIAARVHSDPCDFVAALVQHQCGRPDHGA